MSKKFWKVTDLVEGSGSTLIFDGPISQDSWWGDEVTPALFREELKNITTKNLTVVINSPGGDVWAATSIYDALKEHDGEVTVKISGLAASAASLIAMAGDKIIMSPGSTMMVHRASSFAFGNAADLQKTIEMLEAVEDGIVSIYADRTGLSVEEVKSLLDAETWMSAEKAVELGFADEVVKPVSTEDQTADNVFKGNFAFSMTAVKNAEKTALDSFAKKVTDSHVAKEPEIPPVVEEVPELPKTVENPEDKLNEEKEIEDMTKVVDEKKTPEQVIAENQVIAPADQAPVVPKATQKDYLKSRASVEDFANVLAANAGGTAAEVKAAWGEHLAVKMEVTNPDILLPVALISAIEDAFKEGGEIWSWVNKTGLTVFRNAIDTVTGEASRAKGHQRGDDKGEEQITLADRVVRAQFIYKYLTLNKEDLRENKDTGALLKYVLSELPRRIVREIERAIVIGDGRANDSDYKITSFTAIKADAVADNAYATTYEPATSEPHYESLLRAKALVKADGPKYLVSKSGFLTDLLLEQSVNGGYIFAPGTDVAKALGFAGSVEPDWMDDDTVNDAYIFVAADYTTVGDNSIESFTNFILKTNKQEYLQEIYAGGALTARDSAVAIAVTPTS